eukprot:CAMPEP_0168181536 /NCGR_PEP_ID=MMETSP0139_2-20121125/11292_1 /TAXON_ID=44445 /ORGANISM="Pseudo-nitzschia australis, Strain 10249 10 AB" /LENGTH=237 /DNA_ID=CAMNT_0008102165 /DNA_START=168 /DNA_END=882 /DNA_ORIENTATION=-
MTQKKPVLRHKEGSTIVPGDRIGTIRQARPGGTCVRGGHVYACLLGRLTLTEATVANATEDSGGTGDDDVGSDGNGNSNNQVPAFVCSIISSKPPATNQVLKVGQRVVGRVSRITPQNALVEIRVAEGVGPLRLPHYEGAIRLEDVRSFVSSSKQEENIATVLGDCFRSTGRSSGLPRHQHGRFEAVLLDNGGNRVGSGASAAQGRSHDPSVLEGNGMPRNRCKGTPKVCEARGAVR